MEESVAQLVHTDALDPVESTGSMRLSGSNGPSRRYLAHLARRTVRPGRVSPADSRPLAMTVGIYRGVVGVERLATNGRTVRATIPLALADLDAHRADLEKALMGSAFSRTANRQARAILSSRLLFARSRAATRGRVCSLTLDGLCELFTAQGGLCAITRLPLDIGGSRTRDDRWRKPFRVSLDRIDSSGGYTPENVRLVCAAVNNALGPWGEVVFAVIAQAFMAKTRG